VVAEVRVSEPEHPPSNPMEVSEVRLFETPELPSQLAHSMRDMLENARNNRHYWE
jgi:hypothetical protein